MVEASEKLTWLGAQKLGCRCVTQGFDECRFGLEYVLEFMKVINVPLCIGL